MKFITEEDLRDVYKKQPFTSYDLQPGERLTPGARQFLVDRGIDMYDRNDPFICGTDGNQKSVAPTQVSAEDRRNKQLNAKLKSLQAQFLLTAEELLQRDVCLAQQVTGLARQFTALGSISEGRCEAADLNCSACTGMNGENFSEDLGDCFEISEFHMQMEKGREMLLLAKLRSDLQELEAVLPDFVKAGMELQQTERRLNQIINSLSQMICSALGGRECQRNI